MSLFFPIWPLDSKHYAPMERDEAPCMRYSGAKCQSTHDQVEYTTTTCIETLVIRKQAPTQCAYVAS